MMVDLSSSFILFCLNAYSIVTQFSLFSLFSPLLLLLQAVRVSLLMLLDPIRRFNVTKDIVIKAIEKSQVLAFAYLIPFLRQSVISTSLKLLTFGPDENFVFLKSRPPKNEETSEAHEQEKELKEKIDEEEKQEEGQPREQKEGEEKEQEEQEEKEGEEAKEDKEQEEKSEDESSENESSEDEGSAENGELEEIDFSHQKPGVRSAPKVHFGDLYLIDKGRSSFEESDTADSILFDRYSSQVIGGGDLSKPPPSASKFLKLWSPPFPFPFPFLFFFFIQNSIQSSKKLQL